MDMSFANQALSTEYLLRHGKELKSKCTACRKISIAKSLVLNCKPWESTSMF
jgi:S-adenosylhomocysteine hydrolase